mmetsp:Transcript_5567/g.7889  ORF Transcript_5567/g.7889 Transcript_5567/m.7889 type:complete len:158 (+) Transcript_5567:100-573(+)
MMMWLRMSMLQKMILWMLLTLYRIIIKITQPKDVYFGGDIPDWSFLDKVFNYTPRFLALPAKGISKIKILPSENFRIVAISPDTELIEEMSAFKQNRAYFQELLSKVEIDIITDDAYYHNYSITKTHLTIVSDAGLRTVITISITICTIPDNNLANK